MSCIAAILKLKGDKSYLVKDFVAIESGGEYKGYDFLITLTTHGYRCGYVAISPENKLYGKNLSHYEERQPDLNVHGGVTFHEKSHIAPEILGEDNVCDDGWIGFDADHYNDLKDYATAKKVFSDYPKILKKLNYMEKLYSDFHITDFDPAIRDNEYMTNQCKNLIESIIECNK